MADHAARPETPGTRSNRIAAPDVSGLLPARCAGYRSRACRHATEEASHVTVRATRKVLSAMCQMALDEGYRNYGSRVGARQRTRAPRGAG